MPTLDEIMEEWVHAIACRSLTWLRSLPCDAGGEFYGEDSLHLSIWQILVCQNAIRAEKFPYCFPASNGGSQRTVVALLQHT